MSLDDFKDKPWLVLVFLWDVESRVDLELLKEVDRSLEKLTPEAAVLAFARMTARTARSLSGDLGLRVPLLADANSDTFRRFDADARFDVLDEGRQARCVAVVADENRRVRKRLDPLIINGDVQGAVGSIIDSIAGR